MTNTQNPEELNQISEEDFDLYKGEAEVLDLDLDLDETPIEDEENIEGHEGFAALAALRQALRDLSERTADACNNNTSYIPNISDFNHPLNFALRWGYYDYFAKINGMAIQSIRLGPQLLVRAAPQSVKTLPVKDEPFTEFWLSDFEDTAPSPSLQEIKAFLDQHEDDIDPIPEALLEQAREENPDAITKPFKEFAPYGGYANSKTPKELRLNLKLVVALPEAIKTLSTVLKQAVNQVENSFARMSPTQTQGDSLASSEDVDRGLKTFSDIASLPPTSKPKTAAGYQPSA